MSPATVTFSNNNTIIHETIVFPACANGSAEVLLQQNLEKSKSKKKHKTQNVMKPSKKEQKLFQRIGKVKGLLSLRDCVGKKSSKKQLEPIQEHHFHGGTEVPPYQPIAPSRIQTVSTAGSSSYYDNYARQSEDIKYSLSTKNHLYRMQSNVGSDIVTSHIELSPSDDAYIAAMKKDERKDSQREVLATKWTRSVDLVSRLEIYRDSRIFTY